MSQHDDEFFGYESAIVDESPEWFVVGRGEQSGTRIISPRWFTARYEGVGLPPLVLEVEIADGGKPWCRRLTVIQPDRPGVTTAGIRELPLARIVRELAASRREPAVLDADGRVVLAPATSAERDRFLAEEPPRRTHLVTDELLEEVARLYRSNPGAPAKAVHEQLVPHVSRATAGRYIAEARRRGKLRSATPRRAGEH